jgi:uncharacterized membrane protein YccF (DUF307 family)
VWYSPVERPSWLLNFFAFISFISILRIFSITKTRVARFSVNSFGVKLIDKPQLLEHPDAASWLSD